MYVNAAAGTSPSKPQSQNWAKEKRYLERIAALMETDETTLKRHAKIKLWEDGPNYQKVVTYVNNSQCHANVQLSVVNIHRVWRRGDKADFFEIHDGVRKAPERMFLWHGTKRVNIPHILDKGFQVPRSNGQMFGAGIYFADRISKSSNYSDNDVTFLLLCEVAVGKIYSCANAHNDWISPKPGFDSVKANGKYVPDWTDYDKYYGATIPFGKTALCTKYPSHVVNFNEFIVYDPEKIIIRFLVEVRVSRNYSPLLQLVVPNNLARPVNRKRGIANGDGQSQAQRPTRPKQPLLRQPLAPMNQNIMLTVAKPKPSIPPQSLYVTTNVHNNPLPRTLNQTSTFTTNPPLKSLNQNSTFPYILPSSGAQKLTSSSGFNYPPITTLTQPVATSTSNWYNPNYQPQTTYTTPAPQSNSKCTIL